MGRLRRRRSKEKLKITRVSSLQRKPKSPKLRELLQIFVENSSSLRGFVRPLSKLKSSSAKALVEDLCTLSEHQFLISESKLQSLANFRRILLIFVLTTHIITHQIFQQYHIISIHVVYYARKN